MSSIFQVLLTPSFLLKFYFETWNGKICQKLWIPFPQLVKMETSCIAAGLFGFDIHPVWCMCVCVCICFLCFDVTIRKITWHWTAHDTLGLHQATSTTTGQLLLFSFMIATNSILLTVYDSVLSRMPCKMSQIYRASCDEIYSLYSFSWAVSVPAALSLHTLTWLWNNF